MFAGVDPRLHVGFLAVSAVVTGAMAVYAARNRTKPGALWLAATLAATTVWTATYAAGLVTYDPAVRPLWEQLQWFGTAFLPVFFLLFALEYTGHDRLVTPRRVGLLSVLPAVSLALVWTNGFHGLMWLENEPVVQDGLATMVATFGPWFWVHLVYSYALVLVGAALLARLALVSEYLYTDQSVLLLVGVFVPLVGNVVAVFVDTSPPGLDLTPYGFAVWGLALFGAVYRQRLFALLPATRALGRRRAVGELEDAVVILDDRRSVVYLNGAAAELFEREPGAAVGEPVEALFDPGAIDFDAPDSLGELALGDGTYEVRHSTMTSRRGDPIGYTLVVTDVTERARTQDELERRRDELERLESLNATIRATQQGLLSATTREDVERVVCERLAASPLYDAACVADLPTWRGEGDGWTCSGADAPGPNDRPVLGDGDVEIDESGRTGNASAGGDGPTDDTVASLPDSASGWLAAPLAAGPAVHGVLAVRTDRAVPGSEYEVLAELGALVGQAIDAAERRALLGTERVLAVDLESPPPDAVLAAVSEATGARLELAGTAADDPTVYLAVSGAPTASVRSAFEAETGEQPRRLPGGDSAGVLEWVPPVDSLLGSLVGRCDRLTSVVAEDGLARLTVEVAGEEACDRLCAHVETAFPETEVVERVERERAATDAPAALPSGLEELTDRQREVLEAAYRAGYFEWPRDATAEEVAEELGITPPTLHGHLRKAQGRIVSELFEEETK